MNETIKQMLGPVADSIEACLAQTSWGEEEIEAAARRHPDQADLIWHAFMVIMPTHERMSTEFVYRSHCRELLDRVARGEDTRPGTAAEVVLALSDVCKVTPITTTANGLAARMWQRAGFAEQVGDPWDLSREHYQALRAADIDEAETFARSKTSVADRRIARDLECAGLHHGQPVPCRFVTVTAVAA